MINACDFCLRYVEKTKRCHKCKNNYCIGKTIYEICGEKINLCPCQSFINVIA